MRVFGYDARVRRNLADFEETKTPVMISGCKINPEEVIS